MADLTPSPFLIGVYFYCCYSIFSHFRVIPVAIFLQHFASDRSHMLSEDQKFQAEPPLYECIKTAGIDRHHSSPPPPHPARHLLPHPLPLVKFSLTRLPLTTN